MSAFTVRVTHDTLTPFLAQLRASALNPQPVLRSMGNTLLSLSLIHISEPTRPY